MPNSKIILTKTSRPNATPHPNDLDYGELAINYEDGLLFFKNTSNRISKIASSASFSQLTRHLADRENPHEVNKGHIGLDRVDNTSDDEKQISEPARIALSAKVDLTTLNTDYYNRTETDGRIEKKFGEIAIQVADASITTPAGNLSYDKDTTTFTFTKVTIPTLQSLGALASDGVVVNNISPTNGTGSLVYQGGGVFNYNKPTIDGLGGYAKTQIGLNYKAATVANSDGTLTYNDGFFTYDKPTIGGLTQGKITLTGDILNIEGFATQADLDQLRSKQDQDNQSRIGEETTLDGNITNLQQQISNNDDDITDLQQQITSNDGDIGTIQGQISSLQQQITNNDVEIEQLELKDTTLEGNIADLQQQINLNDNDITALQQKDLGLEAKIDANDDDITALQAQIDANDADNLELRGLITANDSTADITSLQDQISSNDGDITNLQQQITANDGDITTLQQTDASHLGLINQKVHNMGSVTGIMKLTQQAYEDLPVKSDLVLYVIVD